MIIAVENHSVWGILPPATVSRISLLNLYNGIPEIDFVTLLGSGGDR